MLQHYAYPSARLVLVRLVVSLPHWGTVQAGGEAARAEPGLTLPDCTVATVALGSVSTVALSSTAASAIVPHPNAERNCATKLKRTLTSKWGSANWLTSSNS